MSDSQPDPKETAVVLLAYLRQLKSDRGAMADLRRALNPAQRHRAWPLLGAWAALTIRASRPSPACSLITQTRRLGATWAQPAAGWQGRTTASKLAFTACWLATAMRFAIGCAP